MGLKEFLLSALPWPQHWLQHFQGGPDGCQELSALAVAGRKEQSSGAKGISLAVTCHKC